MANPLEALFGAGSSARQFLLWGVGQQIAGAILLPPLTDVQQGLWAKDPIRVLSPAELADMVVKNILSEQEAAGEAAQSGINGKRFHDMVLDTGEPPGLEQVLQMWRRGFIQEGPDTVGVPSVDAAIRTSRLRDEWADAIKASRIVPIPVAEAVDAVLRNQIPKDQGEAIAFANGIDPPAFQILLNTAGNPPSPTELAEFVRRGLIPVRGLGPDALSFEQGIHEGDSKDKWERIFEHLTEAIPPSRTVATLLSHGVISRTRAEELWQENGLSPENAAAYAASATAEKVAAHKELAIAEVTKAYEDRLVGTNQATAMLGALGYDSHEASLVLAITDFVRERKALDAAVAKVGNLFVSHKIDVTSVTTSLNRLGVPAAQVDQLVQTWSLERDANVKVLTIAEITSAWAFQIISQDEALAELRNLGFTARDAWIVLSVKNKGPLPGTPPQ